MKYLIITAFIISTSLVNAATFSVETSQDGKTSSSIVTIPDIEVQVGDLQERLKILLREVTKSTTIPTAPVRRGGDIWIQEKIFAEDPLPFTETSAYGTGASAYASDISCLNAFSINYRLGGSGPEVLAVQKFLNRNTETHLAESGVGSPGQETDYFGVITFEAVKRFQALYGAEVLESIGISTPTGFWGPSTRKTANTLAGCDIL